MSKSVKLDLEPNYNFQLIGIVTSEPIYRLSWLINEQFGILLTESATHVVYHPKAKIEQNYNRFSCNTDNDITFNLIQNKSENGLLIEEQKQVDYWLKIEHGVKQTKDIIAKLKKIKNISLAFEVIPGSLKSKSRIIITQEPD